MFDHILVMKIPILLFIFVMFFGTYLLTDANATTHRDDPSLPQVHLQLVLRNSDGQLVSYFQTDAVRIYYLDLTHQFLDSVDNKITFVKDGITHERIQWQKTEYFDGMYQPNIYALMLSGLPALMMVHGPYFSEPGDTITVIWDIIRIPP